MEKHNHMMIMVLIIVGLLTVTIVALTRIQAPSQGADQQAISVAGRADLSVAPDEATVYISVITKEPTAKRAQEENARLMNTVMEALGEAGLDEDQMETTRFSLYPRQTYDRTTGKYKDEGFEATHTLELSLDDVEKVGDYIDVAVRNGATSVERVSFSLSPELQKATNDDVLGKAAGEARDKAESIADALGVSLGEVVGVSESNFDYMPFDYYPEATMAMDEGVAVKSTSISPEDVSVRASVQVSYAIK